VRAHGYDHAKRLDGLNQRAAEIAGSLAEQFKASAAVAIDDGERAELTALAASAAAFERLLAGRGAR